MNEREELQALRRLAELERRAAPPRDSAASRFATGVNVGMDRAAAGLRNLMPEAVRGAVDTADAWLARNVSDRLFGGTPDAERTAAGRRWQEERGGLAGAVGAGAADVALTAPVAVAGAVQQVPARLLNRAMAARMLATEGAANLVPAALIAPEDRAGAAQSAALGAAAAPVVLRAAVGAVRGPLAGMVTPEARSLMAQGVQPSPGQAVQGSGWAGNAISGMEQRLGGLPIVGEPINAARRRAMQEWNAAVVREAVPGVQFPRGATTNEMVQAADRQVGRMYDAVLDGVTVRPDSQFLQDAIGAIRNPDNFLSKEQIARADDIVTNMLGRAETFTGDQWKLLDANLGKLVKNMRQAGGEQAQLGEALAGVQGAWRGLLERSGSAGADGANEAYRNMLRVERAASSAAGVRNDGTFTPAALAQAVKSANPSGASRSHRMVAQGRAPLQQAAQEGSAVLGNTVPDSGTAGRMAIPIAAGAGAGGSMTGLLTPETIGLTLAAGAGLAGAYSRPGAAYLTRGLDGQVVEQALRGAARIGMSEEAARAVIARALAQQREE